MPKDKVSEKVEQVTPVKMVKGLLKLGTGFESKIMIKIVKFRPIGSVSTSTVDMTLVDGASDPQSPTEITDSVVNLVGNYFIRVKRKGGTAAKPDNEKFMMLTFSTTNKDDDGNDKYLLQGIT